jgi:hypothetical protein
LSAQWTGEGEDLHSDGLPNFQMREYSHSLVLLIKDGSGKAILSLDSSSSLTMQQTKKVLSLIIL